MCPEEPPGLPGPSCAPAGTRTPGGGCSSPWLALRVQLTAQLPRQVPGLWNYSQGRSVAKCSLPLCSVPDAPEVSQKLPPAPESAPVQPRWCLSTVASEGSGAPQCSHCILFDQLSSCAPPGWLVPAVWLPSSTAVGGRGIPAQIGEQCCLLRPAPCYKPAVARGSCPCHHCLWAGGGGGTLLQRGEPSTTEILNRRNY